MLQQCLAACADFRHCPVASVPHACRAGVAGPITEAMLMFYQDHENIKEGAC